MAIRPYSSTVTLTFPWRLFILPGIGGKNSLTEREPMTHMVNCVKLGRELPGLEKPPFPGELGERLFNNVSAEAWEMWKDEQVLIINHYGLVLADANARRFLMNQLEAFFFGGDNESDPAE